MKIRIFVDVSQDWQWANTSVIEVGETKLHYNTPLEKQKRYEITIDVPHPTDIVKIDNKDIELKEDS